MILVTGGAGFIGSNFILDWVGTTAESVINLDSLTYAGNLDNLRTVESNPLHLFVHGDIGDRQLVSALLAKHRPRAIVNFAAESNVDRSILDPALFVDTNVVGTFRLLEATREHWFSLQGPDRDAFRFLQVSTDEVYGSLGPADAGFTENHASRPNNPYAASKASGDHLVRAFQRTYQLPAVTTNCSNNYGPHQFPEKLIPRMIVNALAGKTLPVYGDGLQVRDWLYVSDHCNAIRRALQSGRNGETYNVGGWNEKTNIEVVQTVCSLLDEMSPRAKGGSYRSQIDLVADRPGHDRRYAIDARKAEHELGWKPRETFETGIRKTVRWYLDHPGWIERVQSGAYRLPASNTSAKSA
jgi:dTDP-glucose 4,6-dehydratase